MEVSFRNSNAAKPQFHLENNLLLVGESSFNMRQWGDRQTDRQMFLLGVLYKESTLTTIPNS